MGGDFNAIKNPIEKVGGVKGFNRMHLAFEKFITSNNIIYPNFRNGCFTLSNKQTRTHCISQKLDHFLLSKNWNSLQTSWEASILLLLRSNHFPISLILQHVFFPIRCPFKFEKMWLREESVYNLMEKW